MEHPEHLAREAFAEQQAVMLSTMREFTIGVNTNLEGELGPEWEH
jgi:hypothetical protein